MYLSKMKIILILTDLSVKTENDEVETIVKLNDDPEKEKKKQNYKKTIVMSWKIILTLYTMS